MAASASSSLLEDPSVLAESIILDLPAIKRELLQKTRECAQRGLGQTFKWLAEISHTLKYADIHSHSSILTVIDFKD